MVESIVFLNKYMYHNIYLYNLHIYIHHGECSKTLANAFMRALIRWTVVATMLKSVFFIDSKLIYDYLIHLNI